ncbi:hypothetical protein V1520DRAFT_4618 [Lipomyces starkeyi]|uniref:Uncharacterized protein n=1 Tax=Lipomyces starkeyi NRRL Y-11557 TaxID=675824 RepID=A0A1E3Q9A5_LIPST|nr:hypothetical protein LIPSTDRAFT_249471 [Lipomyces starkeyi NRRL Y-11557]
MKVEYLYRALVKPRLRRSLIFLLLLLVIATSVIATGTWKVRFALSSTVAVAWITVCASGIGKAACVIAVITSILSAVELEGSSSSSGTTTRASAKRSLNGNMTHVVNNVTYPYFNPRAVTPGMDTSLTIGGLTFQYSRTHRNTSKIKYVFPGLEKSSNELVDIVAEYNALAENDATFSSGAEESIANDIFGFVDSKTMQFCTTLEDASSRGNMHIGWTIDSQDYYHEDDLPPCSSYDDNLITP